MNILTQIEVAVQRSVSYIEMIAPKKLIITIAVTYADDITNIKEYTDNTILVTNYENLDDLISVIQELSKYKKQGDMLTKMTKPEKLV